MTRRELLQMGLDALEDDVDSITHESVVHSTIAAFKAELAKPEPEPIVWMQSTHLDKFEKHACGADSMLARCSHRQLQPDYVPLCRKEDVI